jgi:hypothetical protein
MPTPEELTGQQKARGARRRGMGAPGDWFDRNRRHLAGWPCDAAGMQPGHAVLIWPADRASHADRRAALRPGGRVIATDLPDMVA